jgi:hypothetical protein
MQTQLVHHSYKTCVVDPRKLFDLDEPDPDDEPRPDMVPTILWFGSLMLAGGADITPWPESLDVLAPGYFALYPPAAKA